MLITRPAPFALPEFSVFSRLKGDSVARLLFWLCQRFVSLANFYPAFTRQSKWCRDVRFLSAQVAPAHQRRQHNAMPAHTVSPTESPTLNDPATAAATPAWPSFAALRIPGYRRHFITYMLAMMADNIEHVISYWVVFERFHSPALGGFAVLAHWLPLLLFSVAAGALAHRFDPRRIIQLGMLLFMTASTRRP